MYAPIVVFVYNRPAYTKAMLKALNQNRGCEKTELYIFSDGPRNNSTIQVNEVRDAVREFAEISNFAKTEIIESVSNKGLAKSVISGVTNIINNANKIIVLEDDLITSSDFIEYMNAALQYYESDERIWSIAGYSPKMPLAEKSGKDVYICPRAGSWGWATWKDRWDLVDWEMEDYEEFKHDKKMRKAFDKRSPGMTKMLDMQMNGEIDSWAIRWCYSQFKKGMYTINPTKSKVKNVGVDGSGTHGVRNEKWDVELVETEIPTTFGKEVPDAKIIKQYNKYFTRTLHQRIKQKIKRIIAKT